MYALCYMCCVGPSQKQSNTQLGKEQEQEGLLGAHASLFCCPRTLTQLWLMPPDRIRIVLYILALPVLSGRALDCSGFAKQLYPVGSEGCMMATPHVGGPLGPESLFRVLAQGFHLQRKQEPGSTWKRV